MLCKKDQKLMDVKNGIIIKPAVTIAFKDIRCLSGN